MKCGDARPPCGHYGDNDYGSGNGVVEMAAAAVATAITVIIQAE